GDRRLLRRVQLAAAHRAGHVDDHDLGRVPFRSRGVVRGDGHDRVDLRGTAWKELVLVDVGAEAAHVVLLPWGSICTTTLVTSSGPPCARAWSVRKRATASGLAAAGNCPRCRATSAGRGANVQNPSEQRTSRPGSVERIVMICGGSARAPPPAPPGMARGLPSAAPPPPGVPARAPP